MIYETIIDLFDYRDGDLYWKETGKGRGDISKPAGCIIGEGYRSIMIEGKHYLAHRLIYQMFNPDWDIADNSRDNQVDHIDCVRDYNHIDNLRVANQSQNLSNGEVYKNNKSGEKGVCWHDASGKWCAKVTSNKKQYWGGVFDKKEDAITKAKEMREQLHGEFVNHG